MDNILLSSSVVIIFIIIIDGVYSSMSPCPYVNAVYDLSGNYDLSSSNVGELWQDCAELCSTTSGCAGWVYDDDDNNGPCTLKSSYFDITDSNTHSNMARSNGYITGPVECVRTSQYSPPDCVYENYMLDWDFSEIASIENNNWFECGEYCLLNDDCTMWQYDYFDGYCRLGSATFTSTWVTNSFLDANNVYVGERGCPYLYDTLDQCPFYNHAQTGYNLGLVSFIERFTTYSWEDCATECESRDDCAGWTMWQNIDEDGNTIKYCRIKSQYHKSDLTPIAGGDNANFEIKFITGSRQCKQSDVTPDCVSVGFIMRSSNRYSTINNVNNWSECGQHCNDDSNNCNYWSYDTIEGNCMLSNAASFDATTAGSYRNHYTGDSNCLSS